MNLDEYQRSALKTWDGGPDGPDNRSLFQRMHPRVYLALGVAGEAGELVDKIKKIQRDQSIPTSEIVAELGDVLWYVAVMAEECGYSLAEVAHANLNKLADRQARGVIRSEGDNR
jgi:NTP pyrophosphatase (non-canonical NTP hydrolase)